MTRWRATAVATLFFALGALRAAAFWRDAPSQPYLDLSWDAASHVLIGLDLFDALRRLDLLAFFRTALTTHWWPPLFGLITLPLHALLGRSDLPARVVSAVSYAALPAFASYAVVTMAGRSLLAAGAGLSLTLVLYLTSPQLLEMSRWPMLEGCAAAMGLASILAFCMSDRPRWHRTAFVLAGLSTLLKYHYGFFLLVTLAAGVILRLEEAERATLRRALVAVFTRPAVALITVVIIVLLVLPVDAVRRLRWIPTAENVPWFVYVTTMVLVLVMPRWRTTVRRGWRTLSPIARDFVRFGLSIPGIWCLDPSNARVWYRQMRVASDPPAAFGDQVHRLAHFVSFDYLVSPLWLLPIVGIGIIALVAHRARIAAVPLALHGIWPLLLMTGGNFAAEPRFIASLMPVLFAAAILGWVLLLTHLPAQRRAAVASGLGVAMTFSVLASSSRAAEIESRKAYHYRYTRLEGEFLESATPLLARDRAVLVVLPVDAGVAPTLRLFLRMRMPDVAPDDVIVAQGDPGDLAGRARGFQGGVIAFDRTWTAPPDVLPLGEVPAPMPHGSILTITERRSPSR